MGWKPDASLLFILGQSKAFGPVILIEFVTVYLPTSGMVYESRLIG